MERSNNLVSSTKVVDDVRPEKTACPNHKNSLHTKILYIGFRLEYKKTMQTLNVMKLTADAKVPSRAHAGDAGLDLFSTHEVKLSPGEPIRVMTGIAAAIPSGYVGLICDRSSLGAKGIRTLGGVVDAGYRGEIQVILINLRTESLTLGKGDKIAQMLVLPVSLCEIQEVTSLESSERADRGFGSTGH